MKKQLTKQELRDKQEKKQRILKFVKRSINIVCYCLSVLFLILCVAVGVNSCSSSKDKTSKLIKRDNYIHNVLASNGVYLNNYDVYESLFSDNGLHNLSVTLQQSLTSGIDLSSLYTDGSVSSDYRENYYPSNSYILYNGELTQITRIQVRFSTYTYSTSETRVAYRLNSINIFAPSNIVYVSKDDSAVGDYYAYDNTYYITSLTSGYSTQFIFDDGDVNPLLNTFFIKQTKQSFMFSYDLNYYYMFSSYGYTDTFTNVNFESYDIVLDSDKFGSNLGYTLDIEMPFFISGNQLFNKIRLVYKRVASSVNPNYDNETWDTPWWTDSGSHQLLDNTNCGFFTNMTYVNTLSDQMVNVYKRDTANLVNNDLESKPVYWGYTNSCSWVADMYRHIIICDADSFNNSDAYVQLASLNYYDTSTQNDVAIYSLFDMFSQAFRSITSLFSISIIPGFTIGVLMFMPFVVLIIVTIIRLVKK